MMSLNVSAALLATAMSADASSPRQASQSPRAQVATSAPAADSLTEKQVLALVRRLEDPSWEVRERATDELKAAGTGAIRLLAIAYQVHRSPEIRLRIKGVVEHLVMRSEVHKPGGFLGVKQRLATQADDGRIPVGTSGILIVEVLKGTAAERAGLKRRDVILQLDDQAITGEAGVVEFTKTIGAKEPGTQVELTVLRDGKVMSLQATLGQRPLEYVGPQSASYIRAQERFGETWRKRFDPSDKRAGVVAPQAAKRPGQILRIRPNEGQLGPVLEQRQGQLIKE